MQAFAGEVYPLRGIWANLDGNTRIEAREARFHRGQKAGNARSGRVLKVRTPVSSSCLFCAFFAPSRTAARGGEWVRARNATRKTAYRPDIRAKRTDVLFPVACEIGDRSSRRSLDSSRRLQFQFGIGKADWNLHRSTSYETRTILS